MDERVVKEFAQDRVPMVSRDVGQLPLSYSTGRRYQIFHFRAPWRNLR